MGSGIRWFVAVSLGALLLASAVGAAGPTITEYRAGITPNSFPEAITAGPDGNLWFVQQNVARIGKITPAGVVTEYSANPAVDSGINGIATGPDGNLWFVATYGIGKITPSGAVTDYYTASEPRGIVAGPDGNLWFTDDNGFPGSIRRITTGGQMTTYRAGLHGYPYGITAGPDGNLWFTTPGEVGKITTSGVITEYTAGITASPHGIAAGPDGNLWFAEDRGKIGKITTAGAVTEYSAGVDGTPGPLGISAGPDRNLWFTGSTPANGSSDRIGKITTAGVITEYSAGITTGSFPLGITAGPDGNMWFTEYNGGRIGKLDLHPAPPHPACVVPKVVGKTLTKAKTAIRAAHCSTGRIRRLRSKKKAGRVISESPKPGKRLKNGAKVNLVVSRGRGR